MVLGQFAEGLLQGQPRRGDVVGLYEVRCPSDHTRRSHGAAQRSKVGGSTRAHTIRSTVAPITVNSTGHGPNNHTAAATVAGTSRKPGWRSSQARARNSPPVAR